MSKMLMSYALCRIRAQHLNVVLAQYNDTLRLLASDVSRQRRYYAKHNEDGGCCKDKPQVKGRQLEKWPRPFSENHPPWRAECAQGSPPPNNDPYRIKVPEVMVPPLPATSAKEMGSEDQRSQQNLFRNPDIQRRGIQDLFHNSAIVHPDYWKEKPDKSDTESIAGSSNARLGYHGRAKYQYAFHEPWKPLDRLALLAQAEEAEKEQIVDGGVEQRLGRNVVDSYESTK